MGLPNYLPRDHEGMQVYSTPAHEGLQVAEQNPHSDQGQPNPHSYQEQPNPHSSQGQQNPYTYQGQIQPDVVPLSALGEDKYTTDGLLRAYRGRMICGVAARTFWTIFGVVVLLVVIAAAVGGGIGGSQAARNAPAAKDAASARFVPL
jgi:hypothetical protein